MEGKVKTKMTAKERLPHEYQDGITDEICKDCTYLEETFCCVKIKLYTYTCTCRWAAHCGHVLDPTHMACGNFLNKKNKKGNQ